MNDDQVLSKELLAVLRGGNAHMNFDEAVSDFPLEEINRKVPNGNYTIWHLLEHMRITQRDILRFVVDPKHISPEFPDGYWPKPDAKATEGQWKKTISEIKADTGALEKLVNDPRTDFFGPIPHATGYTVFREILLAADHNVFHLSELITLRRVLNLNPVKEY
jgi:DinB superfamily